MPNILWRKTYTNKVNGFYPLDGTSLKYLVAYINEEISRGSEITRDTIIGALDAFDGGAR